MNFPSNFTFQPFHPAIAEYLYRRCTLAFKKREDFSRIFHVSRSRDWILGQTIHREQTSIDRLPSKIWEIKELKIYNHVDPRASTLRQSDNVGNCSRGFYRLATTSSNSDFQKQWSIQYGGWYIEKTIYHVDICFSSSGFPKMAMAIKIVHITMR